MNSVELSEKYVETNVLGERLACELHRDVSDSCNLSEIMFLHVEGEQRIAASVFCPPPHRVVNSF